MHERINFPIESYRRSWARTRIYMSAVLSNICSINQEATNMIASTEKQAIFAYRVNIPFNFVYLIKRFSKEILILFQLWMSKLIIAVTTG
jgi:hypothetical protein